MHSLIVSHSFQEGSLGTLTRLIRNRPGFLEPTCVSPDVAEAECQRIRPDLVVVLVSENPNSGLDTICRLRATFEGAVIAIGHTGDPKVILRSLQAGATQFLDEAELESEFTPALNRLFSRPDAEGTPGRLLAVLSASGGAGASTVAVNLAACLAQGGKKCALIDLNIDRGDLATLLDLKPQFTLVDVCSNEARLDPPMFSKMLAAHPAAIHLLAAPLDFSDYRAITHSGTRRALWLARRQFPNTVADLEDCFHSEQEEVLQQATGVFLVCRLDFASVRNARRILEHLARLNISRHRIKIVFNQHGQPNDLSVEEATDAIGERIYVLIPHDPKTINLANNVGFPAVLKAPTSKLAASFLQMSKLDFEPPSKPSGLRANLKHLFAEVFG